MIFWQLNDERKCVKVRSYRVPADKKVKMVHLVAPAYHRQEAGVKNDRIIVIFKSGESEMFDFEIGN